MRLNRTSAELHKLKSSLHNARRREKRAKKTMKGLLKDLKKQKLLTVECEEMLDKYKGIP